MAYNPISKDTADTLYASTAQGTKADTAVQPGDSTITNKASINLGNLDTAGEAHFSKLQLGTTATTALKGDTAALPNPNALTFTGAVTASYDGSTATTINIPAGSTGADTSLSNLTTTGESKIARAHVTLFPDSDTNTISIKGIVVNPSNSPAWLYEYNIPSLKVIRRVALVNNEAEFTDPVTGFGYAISPVDYAVDDELVPTTLWAVYTSNVNNNITSDFTTVSATTLTTAFENMSTEVYAKADKFQQGTKPDSFGNLPVHSMPGVIKLNGTPSGTPGTTEGFVFDDNSTIELTMSGDIQYVSTTNTTILYDHTIPGWTQSEFTINAYRLPNSPSTISPPSNSVWWIMTYIAPNMVNLEDVYNMISPTTINDSEIELKIGTRTLGSFTLNQATGEAIDIGDSDLRGVIKQDNKVYGFLNESAYAMTGPALLLYVDEGTTATAPGDGSYLLPFASFDACFAALPGTPNGTSKDIRMLSSVAGNITINNQTNKSIITENVDGQFRANVGGQLIIDTDTERLGFRGFSVTGPTVIASTEGNIYFENIAFKGEVNFNGAAKGYYQFKDCEFMSDFNLAASTGVTVSIIGGTFEDAAVIHMGYANTIYAKGVRGSLSAQVNNNATLIVDDCILGLAPSLSSTYALTASNAAAVILLSGAAIDQTTMAPLPISISPATSTTFYDGVFQYNKADSINAAVNVLNPMLTTSQIRDIQTRAAPYNQKSLKEVIDAIINALGTIPGGGLPVPTEISLESALPSITGGSAAVQYYVIANMDVSEPGHQGRAWCDNGATTWQKVVDQDTNIKPDWNAAAGSTDEILNKPSALPNPNALTFAGAVTGTYDGAAPVSIIIPTVTPGADTSLSNLTQAGNLKVAPYLLFEQNGSIIGACVMSAAISAGTIYLYESDTGGLITRIANMSGGSGALGTLNNAVPGYVYFISATSYSIGAIAPIASIIIAFTMPSEPVKILTIVAATSGILTVTFNKTPTAVTANVLTTGTTISGTWSALSTSMTFTPGTATNITSGDWTVRVS